MLILAAGALAVAALAVVTIRYVVPWHRHGRILALAAEFKANPTQETAKQLCAFLDEATPDEDGALILRTLLDPRVVLEDHYTANVPILVRVACGASIPGADAQRRPDLTLDSPMVNCTNINVAIEDPDNPGQPLESLNATRIDLVAPPGMFLVATGLGWHSPDVRDSPLVLTRPGVYRGVVKVTFCWSDLRTAPIVLPQASWWQRVCDEVLILIHVRNNEPNRVRWWNAEIPIEIRVDDAPARPSPVQ